MKLNSLLLTLRLALASEEGQDIVEYALAIAAISLAAAAGVSSLASSISNGFSNLGTTFNNSF